MAGLRANSVTVCLYACLSVCLSLRPSVCVSVCLSVYIQYCSPEMVRGAMLSTATDMWSVGVLLYSLLAACLPFPITTKPDVSRSVRVHRAYRSLDLRRVRFRPLCVLISAAQTNEGERDSNVDYKFSKILNDACTLPECLTW